jgi:Family of unknown function (DUF5302)
MGEGSKPADDDLHRKFREALERKKAGSARRDGEDHRDSGGIRAASNDKQRREFRRKSGG